MNELRNDLCNVVWCVLTCWLLLLFGVAVSCSTKPDEPMTYEDVFERCETDFNWCINQYRDGHVLHRDSRPDKLVDLVAWAQLKTKTHTLLTDAYNDGSLKPSQHARWCKLTEVKK